MRILTSIINILRNNQAKMHMDTYAERRFFLMTITDDIKYVGVNDPSLRLFEGQYPTPNGMAYNSYVILDDRIAVLDTVEASHRYRSKWWRIRCTSCPREQLLRKRDGIRYRNP